MATFTKRTKKNGFIVHKAEIRIKQDGKLVHRESKTFRELPDAKRWAALRESELYSPGGLQRAVTSKVLVKQLIEWYIEEYRNIQNFGRSKLAELKVLKSYDFTKIPVSSLRSNDLIKHIKERRRTVSASTANNDLIWLRVAFKTARPHFPDVHIDLQVIDDAAQHCRANKLIAKPKSRDRRPTDDELNTLDDYFSRQDKRATIPMRDLMWFAIQSARRESEICSILWSDNDDEKLTGWVRDAKHPTAKEGNHKQFKYTNEAWKIVERQSKDDVRIFPYNPKSVSSAFTKACHACGIIDLRFHDLRHEATSRLFEAGYSIIEVQQFTLHESWATLKRYTNLRPADVKLRS